MGATVSFDVMAECNVCGKELLVMSCVYNTYTNTLKVFINPCENCLTNKFDEGFEQGYEEGQCEE